MDNKHYAVKFLSSEKISLRNEVKKVKDFSRSHDQHWQELWDVPKIGSQKDFYERYSSFWSILKKGEPIPRDLKDYLLSLDRREVEIEDIIGMRKKWGDESLIVYWAARGDLAEERSEKSMYDPRVTEKFGNYDTKASLLTGSYFYFQSNLRRKLDYATIAINYEKGGIVVIRCQKFKGSGALQLAAHIGHLYLYGWEKIEQGKDDFKNEITIDTPKDEWFRNINCLTHKSIINEETNTAILVLFKEKLQAFQKADLSEGTITIPEVGEMTEAEQIVFLAMQGIPNGFATPYLARFRDKQNKLLFGEIEINKIEVKFSDLPLDKPIEQLKKSDIVISEITYYYGPKTRDFRWKGDALLLSALRKLQQDI